jgi:hypothetical protein
MDIRPVRTGEEHLAALPAIEACWGAHGRITPASLNP